MCLWGEQKVTGHRLECCIPVIFQVCWVTNIVNDLSLVYGGPESSKQLREHNPQFDNEYHIELLGAELLKLIE